MTDSFFSSPGTTVTHSYQTLPVSTKLNIVYCYKYYRFISPIISATSTSKIGGPSACTLAFRQQARQQCQTSHRYSTARKFTICAERNWVMHPHILYSFSVWQSHVFFNCLTLSMRALGYIETSAIVYPTTQPSNQKPRIFLTLIVAKQITLHTETR